MTTPEVWAVEIPRPPSLNRIATMHHMEAGRRKARYIRDTRWMLRAHSVAGRFPFVHPVHVEIVIVGPRRERDAGNWEKWIGDALKGFAIYDDSPAYWTWSVRFEVGAMGCRLEIEPRAGLVTPRPLAPAARTRRRMTMDGRQHGRVPGGAGGRPRRPCSASSTSWSGR